MQKCAWKLYPVYVGLPHRKITTATTHKENRESENTKQIIKAKWCQWAKWNQMTVLPQNVLENTDKRTVQNDADSP